MTEEFNLSERVKELDVKIINDEISLLVFLNLRNILDKEFVRILENKFKDVDEYSDASYIVKVLAEGKFTQKEEEK